MSSAMKWYEVAVTDHNGTQIDNSACGTLEVAKRAVTRFRALYPSVQWITVNRKNRGRVTSLHTLTVHNGTTASERRAMASREVAS